MPRRAPLHLLTVRVPAELSDTVTAALIHLGAGGVEQGLDEELVEDEGVTTLRVYGTARAELVRWARRIQTLAADVSFPCSADVSPAPPSTGGWDTAWTATLEPVRVSRTLVLAPAHAEVLAPPDHVVRLEAARAFGFGDHPTTRMAAASVERACAGAMRSVLDVGTGTGVLAIVAARRGTPHVVGIDVDPEAIAVAKRNGRANGVHAQVRFAATPLGRLRATFDLVVANVDYPTLLALAPAVVRAVAPKGSLLLTGMLGTHARDVEQRYAELGFVSQARRRTEGGFALLSLTRVGSSVRSRGAPAPRPRGTSRTTRSR